MTLDETALAFPTGRSEARRRAIHYRRERRRWRKVHPIIPIIADWRPTPEQARERIARLARAHQIKEPAASGPIPDRLN